MSLPEPVNNWLPEDVKSPESALPNNALLEAFDRGLEVSLCSDFEIQSELVWIEEAKVACGPVAEVPLPKNEIGTELPNPGDNPDKPAARDESVELHVPIEPDGPEDADK